MNVTIQINGRHYYEAEVAEDGTIKLTAESLAKLNEWQAAKAKKEANRSNEAQVLANIFYGIEVEETEANVATLNYLIKKGHIHIIGAGYALTEQGTWRSKIMRRRFPDIYEDAKLTAGVEDVVEGFTTLLSTEEQENDDEELEFEDED